MSGIFGVFKDLYIRFMVWLGAEPPTGYERLLKEKPLPAKPAPKPAPKAIEPKMCEAIVSAPSSLPNQPCL